MCHEILRFGFLTVVTFHEPETEVSGGNEEALSLFKNLACKDLIKSISIDLNDNPLDLDSVEANQND